MYNETELKISQSLQNYQRYKKTSYIGYLFKAQAQYKKAKTCKHNSEIDYILDIYSNVFNVDKKEFLKDINSN